MKSNPNQPLREDMSIPTRMRFNAGLREARDQGLHTPDLTTEDLLYRGKRRQGRVAKWTGATALGIGLLVGASVHGLESGKPGPLDNGPEPRLSDQEIAQQVGGNSEAVQKAADEANRQEAAQQSAQPTPTDLPGQH